MKSKRQNLREKRQRQQSINRIIWAGLGAVLVALLGYAVWAATRPATGEEIAIMSDTGHVQEGSDPGPYNSEPPTSGRHYASEYDAGFYEETDSEAQAQFPEGYLVHNLEHGYVIFWYNCDLLDAAGCTNLKSQIKTVLDQENNLKVIAFPRKSIEVPVVMTSWGRMMSFERFDPGLARDFVRSNRNKAPEPNAP
ncbi:MAG TPA: DUF3105 domain-containing protein [Anaerolineales bacterium]|nr:DUF3105 domain-containing protein [Anaerolineales bacterium]